MTAIPLTPARIRKINVHQDLLAVADLIEICFASTLDSDGHEYLRHLRWAAGDVSYLSWLAAAAERMMSPLNGFVWEEGTRIVGNLSLIPIHHAGTITYLIANVAVHPEYRQRGIGRALTSAALDHLRQKGLLTAWLQVRDDNPVAYHLYQSLGFEERSRRTTWQTPNNSVTPWPAPGPIAIHNRRGQDWSWQLRWLQDVYPPDVAWNLPISFTRLSPSLWGQMSRWMRGEMQEQWQADLGGKPVGFLTWEPMRSSADALWLAVPPEFEDQAIPPLLLYARRALARRNKSLSINYPAGRAEQAFLRGGFSPHQTLVWMSVSL
jgi:ribosomal protein S18 acetylase RimI-like enzyme